MSAESPGTIINKLEKYLNTQNIIYIKIREEIKNNKKLSLNIKNVLTNVIQKHKKNMSTVNKIINILKNSIELKREEAINIMRELYLIYKDENNIIHFMSAIISTKNINMMRNTVMDHYKNMKLLDDIGDNIYKYYKLTKDDMKNIDTMKGVR